MSLLVPYDDSALSQTALMRARQFGAAIDEEVIALVVVPDNVQYVRDRGWLDEDEPFDRDRVHRGLRVTIEKVAPEATVRFERPGDSDERASVTDDVVRTIRRVAADIDPTTVFIGSENAGDAAPPVSSVGSPLSEDHGYDIYIVHEVQESATVA